MTKERKVLISNLNVDSTSWASNHEAVEICCTVLVKIGHFVSGTVFFTVVSGFSMQQNVKTLS